MYPMEPPEPKWIDQAHLYIINYDLHRGEDWMGTNPSPEISKKYKKNWPCQNIELLGMEEVEKTRQGWTQVQKFPKKN